MQKVFDLHTDVLNKMAGLSRQPGKPCVNAASLEAGGVKAACCACFIGDTTDRQTQLENVMRQYEVFANLNGYMGSCRIYPALEGLDYAGEELEQLLQIRFTSSSELEAVTRGAYVTLAITDQERAAVQYRSEGIVSPDGIVIYLPFSRDSESGVDPNIVNYCGLSIFVPLTDSFARQYASHSVLSSVYNSDFQQIRQVSSGGVEMILLENEPYMDYPLSGYAAWEERGIGYLVELKCNNGSRTAPIEILMPYLENLEG